VEWQQIEMIKLNQNKSELATKLNLDTNPKLWTLKLNCAKDKVMVLGRDNTDCSFSFFVDYGMKQNESKGKIIPHEQSES
jgi:hypothetical protein